jgi:hypothetical protein
MNDDKKPAPPRPAAATPLPPAPPAPKVVDLGAPIRVQQVHWDRPLQFPGKASETSARSHSTGNEAWTVTYLPELQHFHIEYTNRTNPLRNKSGYVWVGRSLAWEPAAI